MKLPLADNLGSAFMEASRITSSRNGYSRSPTIKGARRIFWRCFFCSPSVRRFSWKPSTRHSGVSSRRRWTLEKSCIPWNCRKISELPWVSKVTSFRHIRKQNSLNLIEASVGLVMKNRSKSSVAKLFIILKVRSQRTLRRSWLVSVYFPLVSVVSITGRHDVDGPQFSLSSTSSSSEKNKHVVNARITESYGTVLEILTGL